mmetsp:Transcript_91186/g.258230  ORF Transcript_91186/g.258230 Transcript_91186/m.258230 type:complete len:422 (-) Transcript_91186:177-1442(-)
MRRLPAPDALHLRHVAGPGGAPQDELLRHACVGPVARQVGEGLLLVRVARGPTLPHVHPRHLPQPAVHRAHVVAGPTDAKRHHHALVHFDGGLVPQLLRRDDPLVEPGAPRLVDHLGRPLERPLQARVHVLHAEVRGREAHPHEAQQVDVARQREKSVLLLNCPALIAGAVAVEAEDVESPAVGLQVRDIRAGAHELVAVAVLQVRLRVRGVAAELLALAGRKLLRLEEADALRAEDRPPEHRGHAGLHLLDLEVGRLVAQRGHPAGIARLHWQRDLHDADDAVGDGLLRVRAEGRQPGDRALGLRPLAQHEAAPGARHQHRRGRIADPERGTRRRPREPYQPSEHPRQALGSVGDRDVAVARSIRRGQDQSELGVGAAVHARAVLGALAAQGREEQPGIAQLLHLDVHGVQQEHWRRPAA